MVFNRVEPRKFMGAVVMGWGRGSLLWLAFLPDIIIPYLLSAIDYILTSNTL